MRKERRMLPARHIKIGIRVQSRELSRLILIYLTLKAGAWANVNWIINLNEASWQLIKSIKINNGKSNQTNWSDKVS